MTLLREVYEHPLDPSYEEAARRRAAGTAHRQSALTQVLVAVLALLTGIGLAQSVKALRQPSAVSDQARELLIEQITERRELQVTLQVRNAELKTENDELAAQVLANSDPALASELDRLAMGAAMTSVAGDAYVVTLSDSARAVEDPGNYPEQMVQAFDLQIVVNALWAGGAEAIAINGNRLGATESVRAAGLVVLVDLEPVTSPYEVVAIGPIDEMREFLARSNASTQLAVLRDQYNIGVATSTRSDAWMSGVATTQLRYAEPQPVETADSGQTEDSGSAPTQSEEDTQ